MRKINIKCIFLLTFAMYCSVFSIHAQEGVKISDDPTENQNPYSFAVLELSSTKRGFLLPRMSTIERNDIKIDRGSDRGLTIYNTTIDCIEFYNYSLDTWLSLCAADLPAEFTILPAECDEIKITGSYKKGVYFDQTNGVLLKVKVDKPGVYSIISDSQNGYGFSHEGKFPTAGIYTIFLQGEGKPINGYALNSKGDEIKFQLNGIISNCTTHILVEK